METLTPFLVFGIGIVGFLLISFWVSKRNEKFNKAQEEERQQRATATMEHFESQRQAREAETQAFFEKNRKRIELLEAARKENIISKYQDPEIVERLITKTLWKGQTAEMVIDSFGEPLKKDTKALKTKTLETWKYSKIREGSYAIRITLEEGVVTMWDIKKN